jgi:hypothetical protein
LKSRTSSFSTRCRIRCGSWLHWLTLLG